MATRQLNVEGRTYYFYNDLINTKNFNSNNLKLDKKSFGKCLSYWIYKKKNTAEC